MAHPIMFDEDDPYLARVRSIAFGFPDAAERVSHGRPMFHTRKAFGYYGGSIKVDGQYVQHEQSILFLPEPDEAPALAQDARIYRPAYLGAYGWLGLDLDDTTDWDEVGELLEGSFRLTAPAKLIAQLPQH